MEDKRIMSTSVDGKYRMLATYSEGDYRPNIRYWKLKRNGKKKYVRYKDLPYDVRRQIEALKVEIMMDQ